MILADTYNSRIRKLQPNNPVRMEIVSGDGQTGTTGTALAPFIVKIVGQTNVPAAGISVTFAVTAGAATLSAISAVTDGSGQTGISATPTKSGTLTITAFTAALTAVFTATINDPVVPVIAPGGIGQNGFSVPPVQTISPGAITTIYGFGFVAAESAPQLNGLSNGALSTNFAGICVTFDRVKAPIFGVAATQVTVAVPSLAPGTVAVQVLRNCGTAGEVKSNVLHVTAQAASPEFLYLATNADGVNPVAAVGADGGFIGINGARRQGGRYSGGLRPRPRRHQPGTDRRRSRRWRRCRHAPGRRHHRRRLAGGNGHSLRRRQSVVYRAVSGEPAGAGRRRQWQATHRHHRRHEQESHPRLPDDAVG